MEVQDQRFAGLGWLPPRDEPFAIGGRQDQILEAGEARLGGGAAPVGGWMGSAQDLFLIIR
jgi:hypothetical protein